MPTCLYVNKSLITHIYKLQVCRTWQPKKNEINIELESTGIGLFVWLNVTKTDGYFNENGFIMLNKTKTVTYTSENDIHLKSFDLEIIHLKTN